MWQYLSRSKIKVFLKTGVRFIWIHFQRYFVLAKSITVQIYTVQICAHIQSVYAVKIHMSIISSSTTENPQIIIFCFLFGMQFTADMIYITRTVFVSSATKTQRHQMQIADSKVRQTEGTILSQNTYRSPGPAFRFVDLYMQISL